MEYSHIAVLALDIQEKISQTLPIKVVSSTHTDTFFGYIDSITPSILIEMIKIGYPQRFIYGRLLRYNNRAEIQISDKLNNCWSRYVLAKELSHLIIDKTPDNFTTDADLLVNWIVSGVKGSELAVIKSEHVAATLAAEILVPYHQSKEELKNSDITSYSLAIKYQVPTRIIDTLRMLSKEREEAYKDL